MKFLEKIRLKRSIKVSKKWRYGFPNFMYKYKELRKYIKELKVLNEVENELYFNTENKSDIEHLFARLMLLRIHDFASGVTILIGSDNVHGIFPVMRALCESVMLLMYVDKHPEYIKKFMKKKERGISTYQIIKECENEYIVQYYKYLSNMFHSNPVALKLSLYDIDEPEEGQILLFRPVDYMKRYEEFAMSLYSLYFLALFYIKKIMNKDWKQEVMEKKKQRNINKKAKKS